MPSEAQGFAKQKWMGKKKKIDMKLSECGACGLVQHVGRSVPYFMEAIRSTSLSRDMIDFRIKQFSNFIKSTGHHVSSVFELGAGEGEYLDLFSDLGIETAGVEANKKAADKCISKGHQVVNGFIGAQDNTFHIEKAKYDAVVSFNFIEHLPEPQNTLLRLSEVVVPGGAALFEVPNFDLIKNNKLFNEFIPDHRCYFTNETFRAMISISGFEVVSVDTIWDDYILSAVARRRVPYQWDELSRAQFDLRDQINKFFYGSDYSQNAIWSAGHQSLATISILNLADQACCIIDSSHKKQGTFAPASGLPIVHPNVLKPGKIKKILVMAAGFNTEIVKKIKTEFSPEILIATLEKGMVVNAKK